MVAEAAADNLAIERRLRLELIHAWALRHIEALDDVRELWGPDAPLEYVAVTGGGDMPLALADALHTLESLLMAVWHDTDPAQLDG